MKSAQTAFLAASWLAAQHACAQFVPAPTDLNETTGYLDIPVRFKQVPDGICETTPGVQSFSGYVDIAEDEHIFFWFFEARNEDPTTAPLTVWINGGPVKSCPRYENPRFLQALTFRKKLGFIVHDWIVPRTWAMWC